MRYFNKPEIRGRDVLAAIKSIHTHEERIEFLQEYQVWLYGRRGKSEYHKRVIERTVHYIFGFICGSEQKGLGNTEILAWAKAINEVLYPEELLEMEEHRLLEI